MYSGLMVLSIVSHVFCVPVIPRAKPTEEVLKRELGEADYEALRRHLSDAKLEAMKKYVQLKPEEREQYIKRLREEHRQRMPHETVYEPGSGPQLKEVWRDEDHLDVDSYSPYMVFMKHDLNADGFLDEHEIMALVEHEIEKVYPLRSEKHSEMRALEMRRMLNAFYQRMDPNHDRRVSMSEFLSPRQDDDDDDEWTPLEELAEVPEFEKKTDDTHLLEYARKQMELHPEDSQLEEVMHMLHGVKGIPDPSHDPSKPYGDKTANSAGGAVHPPPVAPATPATPAVPANPAAAPVHEQVLQPPL